MMRGRLGPVNKLMERILERSADAQIARRGTAKDSPAYHNLTGAITAYGKTLGLLRAVQRQEEFYAIIRELGVPESALEPVH